MILMEKLNMTKNKRTTIFLLLGVMLILIFVGVFFFRSQQAPSPSAVSETDRTSTIAPTDVWDVLLQATPFAYFTPLPEPAPGPIDGTYAKVDQSWPHYWRCLRCADYRVTGGIWKLQFDKGIMRIFYEINKWRSIASYSISGDRLSIFNDPYCPELTGEYKWRVENGGLNLEMVEDACAFGLRAENLTKQSWLVCTSADSEAPGCQENQRLAPSPVTAQPPLLVNVYGGDSRFFEKPPDVIAHANSANTAPPAGIAVSFAEESIPYGIQRVLWWNGDWIEATFDQPYASAGVQFLGEGMIGWARVLFDGQEVWRGNTSEIWSKSGRHGGFVEISGFPPGLHALRVESLGFDFRPVTVASFGFNSDGGVENGETQK
jgi:hypothetical protein